MTPLFTRRPTTAEDGPFLRALHAPSGDLALALAALPAELRDSIQDLQLRARERSQAEHFPGAVDELVCVEGAPVGRRVVFREAAALRLVDIALLPAWRGRGLGTVLLEELCAQADALGLPLVLTVDALNPARALYARLGFVEVGQRPPDCFLSRPPR